MPGRLIAVVGLPGVGKDTVIDALCRARPTVYRVKRVITRPSTAGGEDFLGIDLAEFKQRRRAGAFLLSWGTHDLHYGIPRSVLGVLDRGQDALANLSRRVLQEAQQSVPALDMVWLTAAPEVLARRLAGRGRETTADMAKRLARGGAGPPEGFTLTQVRNDRPLEDAVAEIEALYFPERV
ncbi:phosphonate metabolism protein/1,5-bisphosphokinase (PRPP-forming) PhnN [uncultured Roseobacter sp.]|uniref:phosphonate metabolism protein/1,5-bisphosphokinase (PRPP-forming) PhnN n=1 Tax=uncultured Roseobacter sp. TaxID=114847 RepID=UPI00262F85A9|nr:phosphonate metabolism protein/1,5-bisphosphokinase (PRPP-forming) PhnN [uncultured Roseobacter sp.]